METTVHSGTLLMEAAMGLPSPAMGGGQAVLAANADDAGGHFDRVATLLEARQNLIEEILSKQKVCNRSLLSIKV